MKIAIATDHNGVNEKKELINRLKEYEFIDLSTDNNPTDDYPDFAFRVCQSVNNKEADLGILMCGTGIGMSIAANKVKGIRCARITNEEDAKLAKSHNHANAIAFSAKTSLNDAIKYIKTFINTQVDSSERHQRRVNEIINYERGTYNEL